MIKEKLRVGFNFAGNPKHPNDKNRSIDFESFKSVFEIPNIHFYSFAIDENRQKVQALNLPQLTDLSPEIKDFKDSAELLQQMDIVITIDSALALSPSNPKRTEIASS